MARTARGPMDRMPPGLRNRLLRAGVGAWKAIRDQPQPLSPTGRDPRRLHASCALPWCHDRHCRGQSRAQVPANNARIRSCYTSFATLQ